MTDVQKFLAVPFGGESVWLVPVPHGSRGPDVFVKSADYNTLEADRDRLAQEHHELAVAWEIERADRDRLAAELAEAQERAFARLKTINETINAACREANCDDSARLVESIAAIKQDRSLLMKRVDALRAELSAARAARDELRKGLVDAMNHGGWDMDDPYQYALYDRLHALTKNHPFGLPPSAGGPQS